MNTSLLHFQYTVIHFQYTVIHFLFQFLSLKLSLVYASFDILNILLQFENIFKSAYMHVYTVNLYDRIRYYSAFIFAGIVKLEADKYDLVNLSNNASYFWDVFFLNRYIFDYVSLKIIYFCRKLCREYIGLRKAKPIFKKSLFLCRFRIKKNIVFGLQMSHFSNLLMEQIHRR